MSNAIGIIAIIALLPVVFLLLREVVCWYFKINTREKLLTEIRDSLKK